MEYLWNRLRLFSCSSSSSSSLPEELKDESFRNLILISLRKSNLRRACSVGLLINFFLQMGQLVLVLSHSWIQVLCRTCFLLHLSSTMSFSGEK